MPALRLRPDLEEALQRIQGITAVSVITLADGQPTEIHVLGSPERHAKQIVRDVQSLAMAQFGIELDHRIVSVVQLEGATVAAAVAPETDQGTAQPVNQAAPSPGAAAPTIDEPMTAVHSDLSNLDDVIDLRDHEPVALSVVSSPAFEIPEPGRSQTPGVSVNGAQGSSGHHAATARVMLLPEALAAEAAPDEEPAPRPAIASIMVRTSNGESEATVSVGAGGHMFEGRVVGPAGATHRPRLVAQATLAAVSDLLGQAAEIESAQLIAAGSRSVAVTVLTIQTPRIGEQVMSGSAMVRGDDADAVARSVLDALNRRISG